MSYNLNKSIEERKRKLINILKVYHESKGEKELWELSLPELENENKRILSESHPHCDFGSIHWMKH